MKTTRTIILSFLSTLLLALSGVFVLSANAQELDAPDLVQSFPVGTWPKGLAFDGANIWVTSLMTDNLTKLRAADGANLGSFPAGGSHELRTL